MGSKNISFETNLAFVVRNLSVRFREFRDVKFEFETILGYADHKILYYSVVAWKFFLLSPSPSPTDNKKKKKKPRLEREPAPRSAF